jgi:uncharacterized membrane protein
VVLVLTLCVALPGGILAAIGSYLVVQEKAATAAGVGLIATGAVLLIVPIVYLSVAWSFTLPLIMDKRIDFWPAMNLSRRVVNKHWWFWFAFMIVIGLINLGGLLLCCVGILVTFPLTVLALMIAYDDIFSAQRPA